MSGGFSTLDRARALINEVRGANPFYAHKFRDLPTNPVTKWDDFYALPCTQKSELVADQASTPYGTNRTAPLAHFKHLHQTSGTTTGRPLFWLDTAESWDWVLRCWAAGFSALQLRPNDRLFFPFSFGPFLGFWSAHEAASRAGYFCVPGGGMTTTARLRFLLDHAVTVILCTPTYGLHLAEVAAAEGLDLAASAVRLLIVSGEPGGNIAGVKRTLTQSWGAKVLDHYGLTEVGPVAFESAAHPDSLEVLDGEYISEVLPAGSDPDYGELVLTNLCRTACPLIRYRTGDLVRRETTSGRTRLVGGILGRVDDMLHVRGNNVYPQALETIIRRFPGVAEFRLILDETGPMGDLRVEVEPHAGADAAGLTRGIQQAIRDELLFRVEVSACPAGSLPRFEMKARRLVRNRRENPPPGA